MAHYKNDYSKEEDMVLWQLHEVRHHLAEQHQSPEQINTIGLHVITKHNLNNLKIVRSVHPGFTTETQRHGDICFS